MLIFIYLKGRPWNVLLKKCAPQPSNEKKIFLIPIAITVVASLIMGVIVYNTKNEKKTEVSYPSFSDIANTITFNGNIFPAEEIDVKSSVSGIIDEVYVNIGEKVFPGCKIAKVKIVPDPSDVESAQSNLRFANIALEKEKQNYDRETYLYQSKVITESEYEDVQKSYNTAVEQQHSAKLKLDRLMNSQSSDNNDLQNIVKATTTGTVIDIPIEKGGSVINRSSYGSGTTIATVANVDFKKAMVFKAKIAEHDMYLIHNRQPISIIIKAAKDDTIAAVISKIYPKGYSEQGITKYNIEASINLEKVNTKIYYGYSATAEAIVEKHRHALTINQNLLQFHEDTSFVEILNNKGDIENRIVKTGINDGIFVEILRGLSPKDRLILPK